MRFDDFKFIVLCDGQFDAGFCTKADALRYIANVTKTYPEYVFTLYDVNGGSERELDRIWESYVYQQQEYERE